LAIAIRSAWVLALIVCGQVLARGSPRATRAALYVSAISAAAFYGGLVLTVGIADPWMKDWLIVMPLMAAFVAQEETGAVITATLVAAGTAALAHRDSTPKELIQSLIQLVVAGVLATAASRMFRRQLSTEETASVLLAESEQRRAQAERLASVGRLAAGVAHEINNPLGYVKSNLQLLKEESLGKPSLAPEESKQVWEETEQGLERIRRIVSDLRSFARDDDANPDDRCDLAAAIDEASRLAASRLAGSARLVTTLPAGLLPVRISQQNLVQVLLNLFTNAADVIDAAKREGKIEVTAVTAGDEVQLIVQDDGPGIPADVIPRLFEPFFTTKAPGKGTGLSLALSREFVQRRGGSLTASNRPEGGARFVLVLLSVA
jgi:C4-dicarboxylate-specific signal transduction histidine kinase